MGGGENVTPLDGRSKRRRLLDALRSSNDPRAVTETASALSRVPVYPDLLPTLVAKLDDMRARGSLDERSSTALGRAISRCATVGDVDTLLRIVKDPGCLDARTLLIARLGRWRIPSLVPELMCLLRDEAVQGVVLRSLQRQRAPQARLCIAAVRRARGREVMGR